MRRPSVDVAVVMHNEASHLPALIDALRAQDYPQEQTHFVFADNASTDGSFALARRLLSGVDATVIRFRRNYGFAGGYVRALDHCRGELLALINADTEPEPPWLRALVDRMLDDPAVGVCEARQMPLELDKPYDPVTFETSWCSAGGMLIRRRALDDVGFFDPIFFIYFEDVDLCWRMWLNGWKCVYVPGSAYRHSGPVHERGPSSLPPRRRLCSVRNRWYMSVIYGSPSDVLRSTAAMLSPGRWSAGIEVCLGAVRALGDIFHLLHRRRRHARRHSPRVDFSKISVGVKPVRSRP
ncbi:MAG: glycosyltransferase family 2 protein [Candidatus Eisenbacteria bacterium]|nr:glycosyltransferase family 2 protein [Candidatus Eisenbacteria bacterium]